jgi:hypothetical protein
MLVDIYYDLLGNAGSKYRVSIMASPTGGEPYTISPSARAVSGAVGTGTSPATGLHIVWDSAADGGNLYTDSMRVKVTADLE